MKQVGVVYATPAPDASATVILSAPDLRSALDEVRSRFGAGTTRVALWTASPAPERGPDVVVCVPVAELESRRAHAEEVVARWDAGWLLVESMPLAYRDAARQHLVDLISVALLASAIEGLADPEEDDDADLGF